ncbi:hypothetical protein ONZ43_g330 [Nemania bipapillata]|uniref:Uncharacterized protein n=1 Tax=Nemania bipapillata TaxID=110536 RepID=A0ACC2J8T6_9PEZI|nr:hypothetical protein ONZ43_g330 [Nemania bipapillata]
MTYRSSSEDEFPDVEVIAQRHKRTTGKEPDDDKLGSLGRYASLESVQPKSEESNGRVPVPSTRRRRKLGQGQQPINGSLLKPWEGSKMEGGIDSRAPNSRQPSGTRSGREETGAAMAGELLDRLPVKAKHAESRVASGATMAESPLEGPKRTRRLISRAEKKASDSKSIRKKKERVTSSDESESGTEDYSEDDIPVPSEDEDFNEDSESERPAAKGTKAATLEPMTPKKNLGASPGKIPRIPMSPWKPEHKEFWDPEVNFAWIDKHSPPKKSTKKMADLTAPDNKEELKRRYGTSPEKKQARKAFDAVKEDLARDFLLELDEARLLPAATSHRYAAIRVHTTRGHTVAAVAETFCLAKDAGFKVVSHMMPDLPNVGMERDLDQFREYFENPAFRTDGLKIYPTLVIRGTGLYELWRTGRYQNYTPNALIDIVARILALVPPWTRIYRVQRDIPMPLVTSGVENGNLRELALARMKDFGTTCRDVRTREVGINEVKHKIRPNQIELVRRDYTANGGWETFLAYEDPKQDILVGLLRLRKCTEKYTYREELTGQQTSLVRELHVYGTAVPVHARDPKKFQHQGFGTLLMEEAERIARDEHGSDKISVISGVGVRSYYKKLGYWLDGPYMSKWLDGRPESH